MKLSTKLLVSFAAIFLSLFLLLGFIIASLDRQREKTDALVLERYEKAILADDIRFEIGNVSRELTYILLDYEGASFLENDLYRLHAHIEASLSLYRQRANLPAVIETLTLIGADYSVFYGKGRSAIETVREGRVADAHALLAELEQARTGLFQLTDRLKTLQEQATEEAIRTANAAHDRALLLLFACLTAGLLLAVVLSTTIVRSLSRSVNRVKAVMTGVPYSEEKLPRVETITKDEIGDIAAAFNDMAASLEGQRRLERSFRQTLESQHWVKARLSEAAAGMQEAQELQPLGEKFIRDMAEAVDARFGAIYMSDSEGGGFGRVAGYADTGGPETIRLGEGLAGQAAADNRMVVLQDVPSHYWTIQSALGEAKPEAVIIVPVPYDRQVKAVFELAKFGPFDPAHEELLRESAAGLGVAINRIEAHQRVQELLQESQALTEELQSQSEELQLQQEELKTANDELEAQYMDSERKTAELERIRVDLEQQARQLALASQYKSEFLANMSHELRTPLNSILVLAQMMADNPERNLLAHQVEYADTISAAGNDLLALINDILDLSKIESGKAELIPEEAALSELAEFVERHFEPIAEQQGIAYKVMVEDDVPGIMYTDELKLRQILKNLLANAFKFTDQGEVRFRVRLAREDETADEPVLIGQQPVIAFEVSDTGIGIPKEQQLQVFEAFYQADGTTSRRYGGTGLGLSICRELSQLMGGVIKLASKTGRGSIFTLYLPAWLPVQAEDSSPAARKKDALQAPQQDEGARQESPQPAGRALAGLSVLIVDDDMRNVYALSAPLRAAGMTVTHATNGKEGIARLRSEADIAIVLMDMMMPEMDGYETMRAIRGMPEFQQLPIIALTAKAMKHDRERCMEAGASDYISKPVNVEQLMSLLRVWLYR